MTFFRRFIWAFRFAKNTPNFRQHGWSKSDAEQTEAWLGSVTGMKILQHLQNQVQMEFYDGAASQRTDITQQAMGRWNAVASIKILSEGGPTLANLSGIPAPARTPTTKDSSTDGDPLEHLYP